MNMLILFGVLLIICGVLLFAAVETILIIKLRKFNREWTEGADDSEMP